MSSAANWSYTSKATHWPRTGVDDWTRQPVYGAPVVFACDYKAESKRMTDSNGVEFTSSQILFTEHVVSPGDRVLIGAHSTDAVTAGAWEVRAVKRYADTFEQTSDDYEVVT